MIVSDTTAPPRIPAAAPAATPAHHSPSPPPAGVWVAITIAVTATAAPIKTAVPKLRRLGAESPRFANSNAVHSGHSWYNTAAVTVPAWCADSTNSPMLEVPATIAAIVTHPRGPRCRIDTTAATTCRVETDQRAARHHDPARQPC